MSVFIFLFAAVSGSQAGSLADFFGECNKIAHTQEQYDFCGDGFADAKKKSDSDKKVEKCFNDNLTQSGMNMCAQMSFDFENKKLNEQWTKTVEAMKRVDKENGPVGTVEAFNLLLKGQRAWLTYRDATCSVIGAETSGGSITPMNVTTCLADLTHLRTKELFDMSRNPNNPDEAL